MDGLTEGRIVHYVLNEGRNKGEHRPAIVVRVWRVWRVAMEGNIKVPPANGVCQLQVFTDASNDGLEAVVWKTSVVYDENATENTWHWIEKA